MSMKRVMNTSTGKKLGDRPIGRLPSHIDPDERLIVIRMTEAQGKTTRSLGVFGAGVPLGVIPPADTAISHSPRNMMEGPAASAIQPPMNRAARRKAARQRTK